MRSYGLYGQFLLRVGTGSGLDRSTTYHYGPREKADKIKFQRTQLTSSERPGANPVLLSIGCMTGGFFPRSHSPTIVLYLVRGVDMTGTNTQGLMKINFVKGPPRIPVNNPTTNDTDTTNDLFPDYRVQVIDYTQLTPQQAIEIATGYGQGNMWLDWLVSTMRSL